MWENVERSWHMITIIVDQCRKHFVPKMRKVNLHGWITEHIKHPKKHKIYDKQKWEPFDENRKDYNNPLNIFTMESRRSKEKFEMKMDEK